MIYKVKNKWKNIPLTLKISISYAICSIFQKCLSFITLPLFTRLLTTRQYGQYTVYSSWMGILTIILTLNLAYGSFQTAMVKYEEKRNEYITSILGICILLSTAFLILYVPFSVFWNKLFELPTIFVLLMVAEIFFSTSTQLWMERNRFDFKYKAFFFVTLLTSILSPLLAFFLVESSSEKGYARIAGYSVVNIVIGSIIFVVLVKKGKKLFNKQFWKYAFGFNCPLLIYYFSQVIFNQSDRIMINHLIGTDAAAMYGVAYNLAMILTFVLNSINASYVPWLYKRIKEKKGEDNQSISLVLAFLIGLMVLFVVWYAPEIIVIMAGEQYNAAIYVVAPVAMSLFLLFYSQLFINVEFFYEEKKMLVFASIVAAVLNIVLNYYLIPIFGFVVAGYTTLVSYILFAASNCYAMRIIMKKRNLHENFFNYKALILLIIIFMVCCSVGVFLYRNLLIRIGITVVIIILTLIYRGKFFDVLKCIKES